MCSLKLMRTFLTFIVPKRRRLRVQAAQIFNITLFYAVRLFLTPELQMNVTELLAFSKSRNNNLHLGAVRHSNRPCFHYTCSKCLCVCIRRFFQSRVKGKQCAAATIGLVKTRAAINVLTACVYFSDCQVRKPDVSHVRFKDGALSSAFAHKCR